MPGQKRFLYGVLEVNLVWVGACLQQCLHYKISHGVAQLSWVCAHFCFIPSAKGGDATSQMGVLIIAGSCEAQEAANVVEQFSPLLTARAKHAMMEARRHPQVLNVLYLITKVRSVQKETPKRIFNGAQDSIVHDSNEPLWK